MTLSSFPSFPVIYPGPPQQPADIRTSLLDGKSNGGQVLKDPLAKRDSYASFEVSVGGREGVSE